MSKSDGPDEESRGGTSDLGCSIVDLCPIWEQSHIQGLAVELKANVYLFDSSEEFDQHGSVCDEPPNHQKKSLELHLRISTGVVSLDDQPKKRLLLYKHGDDLRQELLAIQFIERCSQILLASGLDLKLKTFSCQPVGSKTVSCISFVVFSFTCHCSTSSLNADCNHLLVDKINRALSSGFEELFLYQNFANHQDLRIQDPMLVSILVKVHEAKIC